MPKSVQRCSTNMSHSSKVPSSSSSSRRSRAVSLPFLCCESIRFSPPPRRAAARLLSSCSRMSCMSFSVHLQCIEQSARRRGGGERALLDFVGQLRQQGPHGRVLAEGLLQPAFDAFPHPGERL